MGITPHKIFRLSPDTGSGHASLVDYSISNVGFDHSIVWEGATLLQSQLDQVVFLVKPGPICPVFMGNILSWPIFRYDVISNALTRGKVKSDEYQLFRPRIRTTNGDDWSVGDSYMVLNVRRIVRGLDVGGSGIRYWEDGVGIQAVTHWVLHGSAVFGQNVFRLAEYPYSIFFSEEIVCSLSKHSELGCRFEEVEVK